MQNKINYQRPEFYTDDTRNQLTIIFKVKANTLPTLHNLKDFYEVHLFTDGYIGVYSNKSNKYIKPSLNNYFEYSLRTTENQNRSVKMHRIVGFILMPNQWKEGLVIDHINTDKLQNQSWNLEWVSNIENIRRYKEKVLGKKVIAFEQIEDIFTLFDKGLSETAIAKELNCTQPAISQILSGKRWKTHPASIEYLSRLEATC